MEAVSVSARREPTSRSQVGELAVYLPRRLRRFLSQTAPGPRVPSRQSVPAVLLSLDVVGFSAFTEKLAEDGIRGAERLSEILNAFFGRMIELIHGHGGDVWIFAGDAAHVIWTAETVESLDEQVCLAAQCALAIQQGLTSTEAQAIPTLRLRAALGAGILQHDELGGVGDRWLPLLSGEPILQVIQADKVAGAGDVVLSPQAWALGRGRFAGQPLNGDGVRLTAVSSPSPLPPSPAMDEIDAGRLDAVCSYVLPVVAERVGAGYGDFLGEFRTVTVAFMHLSSLDENADLAACHRVACAIQEQLQRFEGSVYQCLRDEKGTTVVAVFGLPPLTHDNDAARAVEAALAIREKLHSLGHRVGIGIGTGRAFCGAYGHRTRRQYSIVGTTINLAARLMQTTAGDGILCGKYTVEAARNLSFSELDRVQAKGFQTPVRTFRPEGRVSRSTPALNQIVGRDAELATLAERLRLLAAEGQGGVVLLRGEAGLGKSVLAERMLTAAREAGVPLFRGDADAIENHTPYYAWRSVVAGWLKIPPSADAATAQKLVLKELEFNRELLELAPLLGAVLSLELPDSEFTKQMSGQIRADNLQKVLLALAARAAHTPIVVGLEDAQWMDTASWALVRQIEQRVPAVLLVLTKRPMIEEPTDVKAVLEHRSTLLIDLKPLDSAGTDALLNLKLAVGSVPGPVRRLILAKAEGNPFYSEELALSLKEAGVIEVIRGECALIGGEEALERTHLPDTLQGLITSRIDRLEAPVQLTLKVASVIGRSFEREVLAGIHPMTPTGSALDSYLSISQRSSMIVREPEQRELSYLFRHAVTHETTYGMLLFAHRRSLHKAVAEYLEIRHATDLSPVYGRLAHHWTMAEVPEKAADALAKAGAQALDAYANQEAVDFFTRALEMDTRARAPGAVDLKRAEWLRMLGEAQYSLVRYDEAPRSLERGIAASGFHPPMGGARVLADVAIFLKNRLFEPRPATDPDLRERCLSALGAIGIIAPLHLWKGDKTAFLHTVIVSRNLADIAGPCAPSAYAVAQFAYLLAMIRLHGASERSFRAALTMADQSGGLLQIVCSNVLWGMFLVMTGRAQEAIPAHDRAVELADRLNAGLWKHRAYFSSGEAQFSAGGYAHCRELFRVAASLAQGAEEHAVGLAHSMAAMASLRLGDREGALAELLAPDGIPLIRQHPVPLSMFTSLGVLAEVQVERQDLAGALSAAEEAEALLKPGQKCDDYYAGVRGFVGIASTYLAIWERHRSGRPAPLDATLARKRARVALQRLHAFAGMYPAAKPQALTFEGWFRQLTGSPGAALKRWRMAARLAEQMRMPYDAGLALLSLGRSTEGEDRRAALMRAVQIFEEHGIAGYLAQAREALNARL